MLDVKTGYIEKNKKGKIKIRKITKEKAYFWVVFLFLIIISLYKIITINVGEINISDSFKDFFKNIKLMFFEARLSEKYTFSEILNSLFVTISLAALTTMIGSFFALFLSFFAATNLSNEKTSKVIKICMSFIRAVPTILWVMIFSVVASIGVEASILGMVFHSVAYLVKAYSEIMEEIDKGVIESLKATGSSWWQIIFQGIIPSSISSILSWTFVRFEINFTNAVVVGAASGAGGIGYEMFMAGTMYADIKEVGFFTYLILIVALILEIISVRLRKKYIK
ncbi:MAG: ABC transporter permease subunit [Leptotrichiaceae bacterium]|nr:ABC transporter permease subunit [Leptotrichiaceae bacterium]MBP6280804.1 ABC transporter permease subunit [Leptotrichiaceae bacterium]MBP9629761.1 ABC transporter permease subunit [Leptotrichiaceae bacterium]